MKLLLENPQRVSSLHIIFTVLLRLTAPSQSADYLRSTIFPELPGHKYGVMLLYYTLLQKFANGGAKFEVSRPPRSIFKTSSSPPLTLWFFRSQLASVSTSSFSPSSNPPYMVRCNELCLLLAWQHLVRRFI